MKFCRLASIFLFITGALVATKIYSQSYDEAIEQMMEEANIPGLSMAYFEGGQIEVTKGFGYKNVETKEIVDEETVFAAASLSKPILAYIVMKLVDENKFDLDTPLHSYYNYKSLKHDRNYMKVTARMVLSHTSGLPNWRRLKLKFRYDPGKQFSYSGEGFVWLQKVLEHLTQKKLEELSHEMVFDPIGMPRSSFIWNKDFEVNFAHPYNSKLEVGEKKRPKNANAAHSLQTTASDYAKFLIALVHHKGFSDSLMMQMLTPQAIAIKSGNKKEGVNWGLGIGLQETKEGVEFWHWGDNGTFKAYFTVSISEQNGIVYFTNSSRGLSITPDIVSLFMESNQPGWELLDYKYYKEN